MIGSLCIFIKLFKNIYFYIVLFIICMIFNTCLYKKSINSLKEANNKLELENSILYKENEFTKSQVNILLHYSNSSILIDKIKINNLNKENIDAINAISNEFYSFFDDRVQK